MSEKIILDPLYEKSVEYTRVHGRVSVSRLQRSFRIGFSRAARLIDLLRSTKIINDEYIDGLPGVYEVKQ